MSRASGTPVSEHPAVAALLTAWQCSDAVERRALVAEFAPPGPVALRSRYRQSADPQAPPGPWDPALDDAQWRRLIELETEIDRSVAANDPATVRRGCEELLALETSETHRVVTVHAHIGLGDIALAADDAEAAAGSYQTALSISTEDGYRFGRVRALTGLGYIALRFHSAAAARDLFDEASVIATDLGDLLYQANCALGMAECEERDGALGQAAQHAQDAYRAFQRLGSAIGEGNAAQRLAAVLHRDHRVEEAREWYGVAHAAFETAGNPMGLSNVLSGLGDLLLEEAVDLDGAQEFYQRALEVAEAAGLRASRAHSIQDLARVVRARGDLAGAIVAFGHALAEYRLLDDILGMTHALDRIAEAHGELNDHEAALSTRIEAVFSIEEFRATHRDDRSQQEYRRRFAAVYSQALAAAEKAESGSSFAVVADCLAGRRLAGLFQETERAAGRGELSLLQEMLVNADQRLVNHRRTRAAEPESGSDPQARRDRIIRLLGATGIRHGLADQASKSLDDLLATVYLPPADEGAALLDALPSGCHALQIVLDPLDGMSVHWLWRSPSGKTTMGSTALPAAAQQTIALLQSNETARTGMRIADLEPLTDLVPGSLRDALVDDPGAHVVIVPVGELWLVPWSALPIRPGLVLAEAAAYVVCPSLVIQQRLRARSEVTRSRRLELWRSPLVRRHSFGRLLQDPGWEVLQIATASAAKKRLRVAGAEAVVVAGHGRPAPGLGHYLELEPGEWLLPVDLIGGAAPRRLFMIACWGGAVPGRGPNDPLSLATLALTAGSNEVLATVGELADSEEASELVEEILVRQAERPLPEALHEAARWMLEDEGVREGRIHAWAPLVPIGTFYGP